MKTANATKAKAKAKAKKTTTGKTRRPRHRKPQFDNLEMTEAILGQFVEGENWDAKAWAWRHFMELQTLPRATRLRLEMMLKLQAKLHEFIHHCDYQHMDYCTSEAIPYELFTCVALLAWERGEVDHAEVERHLSACSSFYSWAMTPAEKRSDRSLEARALHRACRRMARAMLATAKPRPGSRPRTAGAA